MESERKIIFNSILLACIFLVIGFLVSYLFSKVITKPIIALTEVLNSISEGKGDLTQKFEIKSKDEIGDMAKAFNIMASQIVKFQKKEVSHARSQKEMEIAKNIQTSLLPNLHKIDHANFDFLGYMNTADAVGGDYYDVIEGVDGRTWVGIGDVTGHGLMSGLIMMMAQVSINNIILSFPGIAPDQLLIFINKILTKNIRSYLNLDHHMTINFIVEDNPGHFKYAGAHEILLIHRAKTGQVEQIVTSGFWVGIIDDCSAQMKRGRGEFFLEKNDTLLLYTDGVIEIMNKHGEQFDMDRLIEVMKTTCSNPQTANPEDFKKAIINAIENFEGIQKDDITFLICKRK